MAEGEPSAAGALRERPGGGAGGAPLDVWATRKFLDYRPRSAAPTSVLALHAPPRPPRLRARARARFRRRGPPSAARVRARAAPRARRLPRVRRAVRAWAQFARRSGPSATRRSSRGDRGVARAHPRRAGRRAAVRQQVLDANLRRLGVRRRLGGVATTRRSRDERAAHAARCSAAARGALARRGGGVAARLPEPAAAAAAPTPRPLHLGARGGRGRGGARCCSRCACGRRSVVGATSGASAAARGVHDGTVAARRRARARAAAPPRRRAVHSRATAGRDVARVARLPKRARGRARTAALAELHSLGGGDPDAIVGALAARRRGTAARPRSRRCVGALQVRRRPRRRARYRRRRAEARRRRQPPTRCSTRWRRSARRRG